MAENSSQDRTEKATPKRRQEAREEGNIAKSMDVNAVAVLLVGILGLKFMGADLFEQLTQFMRSIYTSLSVTTLTTESIPNQTQDGIGYILPVMAPILGLMLVAGLGSNFAQVGFFFAKKALIPKFSKLSPLKGFKRIFSSKSLVEFAKGIAKLSIVTGMAYSVVNKHVHDYFILPDFSTAEIMSFIGTVLFELSVKIGLTLIFLAAADYAWQKYEFEKSIKMTKQEVKDEIKQQEGSPQIKSRIRSVQKQMSRNRMMTAVPDATVVVTNPTHIAVALLYDPTNRVDAPKVLAMGQRKLAQKIKEIALGNGVPVIENKPLARTLFKTLEVGMEIPPVFYQAVAEILAQVYQMQRMNTKMKQRVAYAG
ncbi:flagellar biosynthesis protein FlhB [Caldithrix abyssi]|nr:flagellar biosynthesis protein FlhB [Caldithrix abyssi]